MRERQSEKKHYVTGIWVENYLTYHVNERKTSKSPKFAEIFYITFHYLYSRTNSKETKSTSVLSFFKRKNENWLPLFPISLWGVMRMVRSNVQPWFHLYEGRGKYIAAIFSLVWCWWMRSVSILGTDHMRMSSSWWEFPEKNSDRSLGTGGFLRKLVDVRKSILWACC